MILLVSTKKSRPLGQNRRQAIIINGSYFLYVRSETVIEHQPKCTIKLEQEFSGSGF